MGSLGEATLDLRTDNQKFNRDMDNAGTKAEKLNAKFNATAASLKKLGGSLQSAGVKMTAFVTAPIVGLGLLAAKLADVQIQAEAGLAAALTFTGVEAARILPDLKAFASGLQDVTTVGDETTLQMLQVGISMGLTADSAKGAVKEAIGLSKAFGIAETTAIRMTASLVDGDTTMLNRYIPALKGVEDEAERVALAHKLLAGAFEVAVSEAENGLGPWKQLGNLYGDLLEDLGAIILEGLEPLVGILKTGVQWLQSMSDNTKRWIVTIAGILAAIGPVLVALGTFLVVLGSLAGMMASGGVIAVGFGLFASSIGAVVVALTGPVGLVVALTVLAIKVPLVRGIFFDIAGAAVTVAERITGLTLRVREFNDATKVSTEEEASFLAMLSGGGPTLKIVRRQVGDLWRVKLDMAQAAEDAANAVGGPSGLTKTLSSLGLTTKDQVLGVIEDLNSALDAGIVPLEQLTPKVRALIEEWRKKGLVDGKIEKAIDGINGKLREQGGIVEQLIGTQDDAFVAATNWADALGELPGVLADNSFAQARAMAATLGLTEAQATAILQFSKTGEEAAKLASKLRGDYGPAIQAATERMLGLDEASQQSTGSLGGFFDGIETGIPVIDGFLSRIKSFLGIFKSIGSALANLGSSFGGFFSKIGGLFKGGGEDAADGFLSGFGGEDGTGIMSKMGEFMKAAGPWIAIGLAVAGPLLKGIKAGLGAIVGFFKGLFGGPSAAEIAGREAAASYRDAIRDTLSADVLADVTRLFPDDIKGASFLAAIQQQLIAAGVAAEEAGAQARMWAMRLFEAEKEGADAVAAVIAQIVAATQAGADAIDTITNTSTTLLERRIETVTARIEAAGGTAEEIAERIAAATERIAARIAKRNGAAADDVASKFEDMADSVSTSMDKTGKSADKAARKTERVLARAARKAGREYDRMAEDALTSTTATAQVFQNLADSISDTFADLDITVPVDFDVPTGDQDRKKRRRKKKDIPKLAHGGIVTRPTVALIGEGGPEAVIPLDNDGDLSGSMMLPIVIDIGGHRIGEVLLDLQSRVLRSRGIA